MFLWVINFRLRIELYLETLQMNPSFETLRLFEKTPSIDNLRNTNHPFVLHPLKTHLRDLCHCCHFLKTRIFLRNQLLAHKADFRF